MYKILLTEREKYWLEDLLDTTPTSTERLDISRKLANPLMDYE